MTPVLGRNFLYFSNFFCLQDSQSPATNSFPKGYCKRSKKKATLIYREFSRYRLGLEFQMVNKVSYQIWELINNNKCTFITTFFIPILKDAIANCIYFYKNAFVFRNWNYLCKKSERQYFQSSRLHKKLYERHKRLTSGLSLRKKNNWHKKLKWDPL